MSSLAAHERPAARYRLGVLFVHGIGVQGRGQTLSEFGRPLFHWLQEWCEGVHERWVGAGLSPASLQGVQAALRARDEAAGGGSEPVAWALEALERLLSDSAAGETDGTELRAAAGRFGTDVLAAGVVLADARREAADDPSAPPQAELVLRWLLLDGVVEERRWLLAESWWAETFAAPRFSELARWGLGIVPWTMGSHYGAGVRRVWSERGLPAGFLDRATWLGRLAASGLRLLAGLMLSLGALAALALLLVVAALPVPRLRAALGALQRRIAASLGDSYILVTRPIEAASIVGQVRRDLAWLAAPERCERVAVVAHSQGAAVAHEALRGARPASLRLLLTFGSGLRKLEELRQLLGGGRRLRLAAGLTLAGLLGTTFFGWALWFVPRQEATRAGALQSFALVAVPVLVSLALLGAGLWDLVTGMEVGELRGRVRRFARSGVRWLDCYATRDPVPNGPVLDPPERLAAGGDDKREIPESVAVHNEQSVGADHTAYWRNLDEFVTLLVAELAAASAGDAPQGLAPAAARQEEVRRWRRWRVACLGATRAVAALSVALAVAGGWGEWRVLGAWAFEKAGRWLAGVAGSAGRDEAGAFPAETLWPTLGALLFMLSASAVVRAIWRRRDEAEMAAAIRGGKPAGLSVPLVMVMAVQVCAGLAIFFRDLVVVVPLFPAAAFTLAIVLGLAVPSAPVPPAAPRLRGMPRVERTARFLEKVGVWFLWAFAAFLAADAVVSWLQRTLGRFLPPEQVPGYWPAVVLVLVVIGAVVGAAAVILRLLRAAGETGGKRPPG